jgi:hypothetical protein
LVLACFVVAVLSFAVSSPALAEDTATASDEQTQAEKKTCKSKKTTEEAPTEEATEEEEPEPDPRLQPTHEQTGTITIPMGDQKARIHSFCLDSNGNLLATCGGERVVFSRGEKGIMEGKLVEEPSAVRVISPEGKLLEKWSLKTTPQSICVGRDGSVYCGGQGVLTKFDSKGKILKTVDSPQVAELPPLPEILKIEDEPKLTEEEQKAKDEKIAELRKLMAESIKEMGEFRKEGLDIGDEEERAQLDARREKATAAYQAAAVELQVLTVSAHLRSLRERSSAMRKRAVTGITVSDKDLFVVCYAVKGYGFEVWRMNLDMSEPKKIVSKLRGCCGQMDIQASDGKLYVAENARKRVVSYDRDGEKLTSWGSSNKSAPDGFGSCCNPMNIRFGPDGVVYTSESNVGRIKRFSPEGELLGVLGTVTIVPGCKHVPIGISKDGEKVFLLDITRSHIVVMEKSEKVAAEKAL